MKRLLGLLKKDFKIAFRNFFFLIVLIVAVILISVVNFLIPEKINTDAKLIYTIEESFSNEPNVLSSYLENQPNNIKVTSKEQVIEEMKKDRNTIGIVVKTANQKLSLEVITQGYENQQSKRALALTFESMLKAENLANSNIETITLKDASDFNTIPANKGFVPLIILNEPVMIGFILLATLIFMEKEEATTKAYMTTPGGIGIYLLSKIILMSVLGLISTVLITVFTVGFNINWMQLILIVIAGSTFSSTVAMVMASFFDNISKAMVWILGLSLVFTVPMASYFIPSFAPKYVTMMPTYGLMFAIREAIFPMGNPSIIYESVITLSIISLVLYGLSLVLYRRSMLMD
jgi:hypothetical protein